MAVGVRPATIAHGTGQVVANNRGGAATGQPPAATRDATAVPPKHRRGKTKTRRPPGDILPLRAEMTPPADDATTDGHEHEHPAGSDRESLELGSRESDESDGSIDVAAT